MASFSIDEIDSVHEVGFHQVASGFFKICARDTVF